MSHFRSGLAFATLAALVGACSPPPPPPKPPPPPPPIDTTPVEPVKEALACNLECAKADALCAGGVCNITLKNSCEQPITCDLFIVANCRSGSDLVEAKARKRETFAAKTDGEMSLAANCAQGEVVRTEAKELQCK